MIKVGVFSGTFDPVHKGHLAFALKAAEAAGLDRVYFLPEALPRRKEGVTHYAHRVAMLRLALKPHKKLALLELPDKQFTVNRTLPRLQKRFKDSEIYMLMGSDTVGHITGGAWPDAGRLLESVSLIVGMRSGENRQEISTSLQSLVPDRSFLIVSAGDKHASSRDIRSSIERGKRHAAALKALDSYIRQNWLYVSTASMKS